MKSGGSSYQIDLLTDLVVLEEGTEPPGIGSNTMTWMAQLVEHQASILKVVSSNPTPGRNFRISSIHSKSNRNPLYDVYQG